ncbi:MAG: preprotein translocase subunit SecY [Nitrospiraceae bacterium]|nr:preprotein translocase subunit SecY [Nitrospiraceae bacterium]
MAVSFGNVGKVPELKRRILVTLGLLAIYRMGIHIPTPGINSDALMALFAQARGTLFGLFDMFAGGGFRRLSIFALGIMPYISAAIILELLEVSVPYLERLSKEGDAGRKKIVQYTRYGTIILSIIQGFGISFGLEQMRGVAGEMIVMHPGWSFRLMTVLTLTAGTAFVMWLGEQITEKGIGNGISLIIMAGIIAGMPSAIINTVRLLRTGELGIFTLILLIILMVAVVAVIVYVETAQRRIPVQYAKRVVGRKMYGGQSTFLPLKINTSGVIPPIFASSIIMFPATIANFIQYPIMKKISAMLSPSSVLYIVLYVGMIFFFCYFYTAIVFNPVDVADNMKKFGGYIPGIRPGKWTADYIDKVLTRITLGGAVYVSLICVLPTVLITKVGVPFYFGGTALLIVIQVGIDTIQQMETHLLTRHYDGLLTHKSSKRR